MKRLRLPPQEDTREALSSQGCLRSSQVEAAWLGYGILQRSCLKISTGLLRSAEPRGDSTQQGPRATLFAREMRVLG